MDENRGKRNELLAATVIKGLESRNMKGYYAATKEEALQKALELIPRGSSVSWGGSMSIQEIGLKSVPRGYPLPTDWAHCPSAAWRFGHSH